MRNLDHSRPYLRLIDNLRRESREVGKSTTEASEATGWPTYLQPIARKGQALSYFGEVWRLINDISESDAPLDFSNAPANLRSAFTKFENASVYDECSDGLRGRDWIMRGLSSSNLQYRGICTAMLLMTGHKARLPNDFTTTSES